MSIYVLLNDDGAVERYPYSFWDLRIDYPNVSFPRDPAAEVLEDYNVRIVTPTTPPEVAYNQDLSESVALVDGVWTQQWSLVDASPEDIAARNEDLSESVALVDGVWTQQWSLVDASPEDIAARNDAQSRTVRSYRNDLLTESDWTQLADATADKTAWASYRQALREMYQTKLDFRITSHGPQLLDSVS
jgi:hypothetical protein